MRIPAVGTIVSRHSRLKREVESLQKNKLRKRGLPRLLRPTISSGFGFSLCGPSVFPA